MLFCRKLLGVLPILFFLGMCLLSGLQGGLGCGDARLRAGALVFGLVHLCRGVFCIKVPAFLLGRHLITHGVFCV